MVLTVTATQGTTSVHASSSTVRLDTLAKSFTGYTYPETSAGLSACKTEGAYQVLNSDFDAVSYVCSPGSPVANEYGLWLNILVGGTQPL